MIPVVALVGRPNVGKSTLFNRFTRTQNALVADFPGLTRDRQYGEAEYNNKPFIVVDTGGIGVDDQAVDELMIRQSTLALDEADIVLFVVDGRSGLIGVDQTIANQLRRIHKPIILVVNKVEGLDDCVVEAEFMSLGFSAIHSVSATHGTGVQTLLSALTKDFEKNKDEIEIVNNTKIAFIGRPNVGKSTLVNRLLGEERVVVYDLPGTTRDSISIPFTRDDEQYTLIDTAGIRRRSRVDEKIEKFSIIKTLQSIKESHVCLMLIDAKEGVTEQDMHLLGFIIEAGKALVILINKWDGLDHEHKERVRSELSRRLKFVTFSQMRFISALHGTGVGLIFKDIKEAYASAMQKLSTPKLTRMMQDIVEQHPPPLVNGRRIKLKYAHFGGQNPPLIVVHGNQLNELPESYRRYLTNTLIDRLELIGTPLKLEFKSTDNPFKDKKNKLTDRQVKRKKRLMKHIKRNRK